MPSRADAGPRTTPPALASHHGLFDALTDGDLARSVRLLERALEERSLAQTLDQVLVPAMREIGRRWQAGEVSIADEHLATNTAERTLEQLRAPPGRAGPQVLLACVQGNRHTLPGRMVATVFEANGWSPTFLGADVPPNQVALYARQHPPRLVGLCLALPEHEDPARETVDRLRDAVDERPPVLLGGLPTESGDGLCARTGAEDWAASLVDLEDAITSPGSPVEGR
jgi:methanogenic corrinoid protein MtbC1